MVAIYYVSQLFGGLLISIYPITRHWSNAQANDWLGNSVVAQFGYILLAEAFTIGAIYLFLKRYRLGFKVIGLRRPRWTDLGYGLAAVPFYYVLYLLTVGVASHLIPGLDVNQQQQIGFDNVHGVAALILTFISLVILPPLTEEIMVRGFLYSSLKKAMPTIAAVIVTSAIFASAHLPEGGATGPLYIAALDTFVLSLVLIYLREKTGGLWASMTLHAVKNGVAFMALFILHVR
ncbi:MAG: type II CAAX endopeptidase family protein [Candidatus Saccharimonadales bacterium]